MGIRRLTQQVCNGLDPGDVAGHTSNEACVIYMFRIGNCVGSRVGSVWRPLKGPGLAHTPVVSKASSLRKTFFVDDHFISRCMTDYSSRVMVVVVAKKKIGRRCERCPSVAACEPSGDMNIFGDWVGENAMQQQWDWICLFSCREGNV